MGGGNHSRHDHRGKIGQLFVYMVTNRDPAVMKSVLDRFHVGAIRYHNAPKEELYEQNRILQENTKIPLLIASNCEAGGNGGIEGGPRLQTELRSPQRILRSWPMKCPL